MANRRSFNDEPMISVLSFVSPPLVISQQNRRLVNQSNNSILTLGSTPLVYSMACNCKTIFDWHCAAQIVARARGLIDYLSGFWGFGWRLWRHNFVCNCDSLSLCVSVCLSPSVCLSVCLYRCLSAFSLAPSQIISVLVFLSVLLFQSVCICVSLYLSLCLSLSLSVCVCPSLCLCLPAVCLLSVCLCLSPHPPLCLFPSLPSPSISWLVMHTRCGHTQQPARHLSREQTLAPVNLTACQWSVETDL